jgi:undecaprenyl phosphate-alpha-L-ara4N flippase subunit ArnF
VIGRAPLVGAFALGTSIVLSALGQLGMKAGMQALHLADHDMTWSAMKPAVLWTSAGISAYVLSLVSWLVALTQFPLSYAYPFLGLSYVLVYFGATQWDVLAEPATPLKTIGTLSVIAGVALISMTDTRR